jgi:hypothetical protein
MDFLGSTQAFMFSKGLVHIGKAFFMPRRLGLEGAFWIDHKKTALGANPGGFFVPGKRL